MFRKGVQKHRKENKTANESRKEWARRVLEDFEHFGVIAAEACSFCKRGGHSCEMMEGFKSCSICVKHRKGKCNAIPLARISEVRVSKTQQLHEIMGRLENIQQTVQDDQNKLAESQNKLSVSLAEFHKAAAELKRCQQELSIITEKHRESLAHAEALLMEEDPLEEVDGGDPGIQEQLNYLRGDVWDLGPEWVDNGEAIPEEVLGAAMEPLSYFAGSVDIGNPFAFFRRGEEFSMENFMEGIYGDVQNNLA